MDKAWVLVAKSLLDQSLGTVPIECNQIDWKMGLSPQKDKLIQHLSAFSNLSGGGYLAFGIDDSGKCIGVDEQVANDTINQLANLGRDSLEPPVIIDHSIIERDSKNILLVHIQESLTKPVYRRGKPMDHTWIRSGGTTRKASRQEIGSLMLHSKTPCWEELRASSVLSHDEAINMLDVDKIASLLKRPLPGTKEETVSWLISEKLILQESEGCAITNFGAIAAAKNLENFDQLNRKRLRVIQYSGVNKTATPREVTGRQGYAVGFEGLIQHILDITPRSEVIKKALRADVAVYPELAIRELIANALIHQDFSIKGAGPMIEIYTDRIEFTNPGGLLPTKTIDRLIGATPESRNEALASAFRRYGICEERGSGFQKIVANIELFGLPPLGFRLSENSFTAVLHSPRSFAEMSQGERIEACYQHAVLQYLSSKAMTNTTIRERLKMHDKQRSQVSNLIADAITAGRIKKKDPDAGLKFAEYVPYWA